MKKLWLVLGLVLTFVMGVMLSDLVLTGLNQVTGGVFTTKAQLRDDLEKARLNLDTAQRQVAALQGKYDDLEDHARRKQANLNSLIDEIETGVNAALVKDVLLTTPAEETGEKGRIFLNAPVGEALLKPTTDDDPTVNRFKDAFNKKARDIIDISKGILNEKIGRLNQEVVRINDELKDRNVQLIGKLQEVEKFKKEVDRINTELQEKNTRLTARLKEVEEYKKELEEQKRYIGDLEDIRGNLEKTVGVLETKIEKGRLKVSFKGDILFSSGRHQLREEGKSVLDGVLPILSGSTARNDIFIAGHTDNVPIGVDSRDRYDSNWTLSTYRALEVVKYLVRKGISPRSLTAAGYGEYKPIADNATDVGKARNRRVELFLIPKIIKRGD